MHNRGKLGYWLIKQIISLLLFGEKANIVIFWCATFPPIMKNSQDLRCHGVNKLEICTIWRCLHIRFTNCTLVVLQMISFTYFSSTYMCSYEITVLICPLPWGSWFGKTWIFSISSTFQVSFRFPSSVVLEKKELNTHPYFNFFWISIPLGR